MTGDIFPALPEGHDSHSAEQHKAPELGRPFPCTSCGATLQVHLGESTLECEFCGESLPLASPAPSENEKEIEVEVGEKNITERDYASALRDIARAKHRSITEQEKKSQESPREITYTCEACGASSTLFADTRLPSCGWCGRSFDVPSEETKKPQEEDTPPEGELSRLQSIDAILPFALNRDEAQEPLNTWLRSKRFAPEAFRHATGSKVRTTSSPITSELCGVFLPYFTFDTMSHASYRGRRGDHETITVLVDEKEKRERRTRWTSVSGDFQKFFDDVLVAAHLGLSSQRLHDLEPWPLHKCLPYEPASLQSFVVASEDLPLEQAFAQARGRIEDALGQEIVHRIGGDEHEITSSDIRHSTITFKRVLLPVWLLSLQYGKKTYRITVNATTGEVQGERPLSLVKIALVLFSVSVLLALLIVLGS